MRRRRPGGAALASGLGAWWALLAWAGRAFAHAGREEGAHQAAAHGGPELTFGEVMGWWSWRPVVLALVVITTAVYVLGVRRLWRQAGVGRGVARGAVAAYGAGVVSLLVALVSPVDKLGAALFSAHMSQHEILMLVAAPLVVLGRPLVALLWGLPARARAPLAALVESSIVRRTWRGLTNPFVVLVMHAVVLWTWHVPALFEGAMRSEPVHAAQHAMFFLTAALFWWALIHGRYGRAGYGVAVLFVFATAMHTGFLGVLLTFARQVWYPIYDGRARAVGVDPLDDQTLAGLIMWVPAGVILVVLALAIFGAWIGDIERRARRDARRAEGVR